MAAFADPVSKRVPAWNNDDLEDDVATISYEQALQAHARYRPVDEYVPAVNVPAPKQTADSDSLRIREVSQEEIGQGQNPPFLKVREASHQAVPPSTVPSSARARNLKCASITIRLSQAECAQLRTRAAEAGLSISAYLRSCTFEAEALRAEVKETLAQLRSSENPAKPQDSTPAKRSWFHWRTGAQAH